MISKKEIFVLLGIPRTRKSNPFSKWVRPLFEKRSFRRSVGGLLVAWSLFFSSVIKLDYGNVKASYSGGVKNIVIAEKEIKTEKTIRFPLEKRFMISQGFSRRHKGVDIPAPYGTKVVAVKGGIVRDVGYEKGGYGKHVIVEHEKEIVSLYAHLSKVYVKKGEKVKRGEWLGQVGNTGKSTGMHLHFELVQQGEHLNPALWW